MLRVHRARGRVHGVLNITLRVATKFAEGATHEVVSDAPRCPDFDSGHVTDRGQAEEQVEDGLNQEGDSRQNHETSDKWRWSFLHTEGVEAP